MKKIIVSSLLVLSLFWGGYFVYEYKTKKMDYGYGVVDFNHPQLPVVIQDIPQLDCESFIVIDVETNTILAQKESHKRLYPASITKLVTALTALNIYPLDEKLKVSEYTNGKVMGLVDGDELTVRDLVRAILVHSANDAAYNLAINHRGKITGFVEEMNKLINKYGLSDSHFMNFDGIDEPNHYSSAYDLAQIGRLAIKNQTIKETALLTNLTVVGDLGVNYELQTTDELLGVIPEIKGLKTGWTPEAGGCFLGLIEINGHQLISVVLNSQDRFADTIKVVDWIKTGVSYRDYSWEM